MAGLKERWRKKGGSVRGGNSKKRAMYYEEYKFSALEYLRYFLEGILLCWSIGFLFYRSFVMCLISTIAVFFYIKEKRKTLVKKRKQVLVRQFKESIVSLSGTLKAGYSIENAWKETGREMEILLGKDSYMAEEIRHMKGQMELNVPLEDLLYDFGKRSGEEDIENFVAVFLTAKRKGGDFVGIIEETAGSIGEKIEVKQEIETMIAAKQFEHKVMCIIPFFIILYMQFSFPKFSDILYGNLSGGIIMSCCLVIYIFAYIAGRKIVEIEV